MTFTPFIEAAERYYSGRFGRFGPTPAGVDWRDEESQVLRFEQLLKVVSGTGPFTLNDYGCGYGALAAYLIDRGGDFRYVGFDVSQPMIAYARDTFADERVRFVEHEHELAPANYTVASGIFNVKMEADPAAWTEYVLATLGRLRLMSTRGFAFNVLTSYSDSERIRDDLYYADPAELFRACKERFSRHVALLHDYGLWEFTVLVRLEPA